MKFMFDGRLKPSKMRGDDNFLINFSPNFWKLFFKLDFL